MAVDLHQARAAFPACQGQHRFCLASTQSLPALVHLTRPALLDRRQVSAACTPVPIRTCPEGGISAKKSPGAATWHAAIAQQATPGLHAWDDFCAGQYLPHAVLSLQDCGHITAAVPALLEQQMGLKPLAKAHLRPKGLMAVCEAQVEGHSVLSLVPDQILAASLIWHYRLTHQHLQK